MYKLLRDRVEGARRGSPVGDTRAGRRFRETPRGAARGETQMESLSPVMFVDEVEPCVDFWVRLGFEVVDTVPHGDVLGFAMLTHGGVMVMLQSRASLADDMPAVNELARGHNLGLFLRVASLDEVLGRLTPQDERLFEERVTFYGMREVGVLAPGGFPVTFAQRVAQGG